MNPSIGLDQETIAMQEYVATFPLAYRHFYTNVIQERINAFDAGVRRVDGWKQERVQQFDPELRVRWDFMDGCYCVDKWVSQISSWVPLLLWKWEDTQQPRPLGEEGLRDLFAILHAGDMQRWDSPEKYLEFKRAKSAAIRARHRAANTEKVLEALDSLTEKRIKEFVAVERALRTGETVVSHGKQQVWLENLHTLHKKALAAGHVSDQHVPMNPGMAPNTYVRNRNRKDTAS